MRSLCEAGGKEPVDHVGESVIGDGDFTSVITIDAATRYPAVELRRND